MKLETGYVSEVPPPEDAVWGWHILGADRRLAHGDGRIVTAGKTYSMMYWTTTYPGTGDRGMRCRRRLARALSLAPGTVICRVAVWGRLSGGRDEYRGDHLHVQALIEADRLLHEFALHCATVALLLANVEDPRCWQAIEGKWAWLEGDLQDGALNALRNRAQSVLCELQWSHRPFWLLVEYFGVVAALIMKANYGFVTDTWRAAALKAVRNAHEFTDWYHPQKVASDAAEAMNDQWLEDMVAQAMGLELSNEYSLPAPMDSALPSASEAGGLGYNVGTGANRGLRR